MNAQSYKANMDIHLGQRRGNLSRRQHRIGQGLQNEQLAWPSRLNTLQVKSMTTALYWAKEMTNVYN